MARPNGDNGKPNDTAIKDVLSPFRADHSALTDCTKLVEPPIQARRAIVIYGFDDDRRPLEDIVNAFEILARSRVNLGRRHTSRFGPLVHPVHRTGEVFAWEIVGDAEATGGSGR
jgi:hypothetical protein